MAYPFLVYLGLSNGYEQQVGWVLAVLLLTRLGLALGARGIGSWLLPISACGLLVVTGAIVRNDAVWLQFYPVVVNAVMAVTFAMSLFQSQSMIERFARIKEPHLSAQGVKYTRVVTQIWCAFFVINAICSTYTIYLNDLSIWTLYNGFIAYILMGILGAGEWLFRTWLKRQGRLV
ncbi:hypothetical protein AAEU32_13860 [Pseudoalteromonas sp. SSDWG2]|uniref:COG4648 family protein n=1 Tax=Pseudoalteromonas sp. SSDWG2 TaxID=3139391 RepID=UPI003BA89E07